MVSVQPLDCSIREDERQQEALTSYLFVYFLVNLVNLLTSLHPS